MWRYLGQTYESSVFGLPRFLKHESVIRQKLNDQAAIFKGAQLQELEGPVDLEEDLSIRSYSVDYFKH